MLVLDMKNNTVKISKKLKIELLLFLDCIDELQETMFEITDKLRYCILNNQIAQTELMDFNYYNEEIKNKNKILINELSKIYF